MEVRIGEFIMKRHRGVFPFTVLAALFYAVLVLSDILVLPLGSLGPFLRLVAYPLLLFTAIVKTAIFGSHVPNWHWLATLPVCILPFILADVVLARASEASQGSASRGAV